MDGAARRVCEPEEDADTSLIGVHGKKNIEKDGQAVLSGNSLPVF